MGANSAGNAWVLGISVSGPATGIAEVVAGVMAGMETAAGGPGRLQRQYMFSSEMGREHERRRESNLKDATRDWRSCSMTASTAAAPSVGSGPSPLQVCATWWGGGQGVRGGGGQDGARYDSRGIYTKEKAGRPAHV